MITATYRHTWKSAFAAAILAFVVTPMALLPIMAVVSVLLTFGMDVSLPDTFPVAALVMFPVSVVLIARGMVKAGEIRVTLDETGYTREQIGKMSATIEWAAAKGVFRKFGQFVVRVPGGAIAAVPESAFTAEQLAEIDAFLRSREAAGRTSEDKSAS